MYRRNFLKTVFTTAAIGPSLTWAEIPNWKDIKIDLPENARIFTFDINTGADGKKSILQVAHAIEDKKLYRIFKSEDVRPILVHKDVKNIYVELKQYFNGKYDFTYSGFNSEAKTYHNFVEIERRTDPISLTYIDKEPFCLEMNSTIKKKEHEKAVLEFNKYKTMVMSTHNITEDEFHEKHRRQEYRDNSIGSLIVYRYGSGKMQYYWDRIKVEEIG